MSAHSTIIKTASSPRQFHIRGPVQAVALAAVAVAAVALRFGGLSRQSLWADEGNSWGMAIRSLGEIGPAAAGDIHPPLYYYLLNLWCRLFGTSEAGMRSLSALFGCLTVLVIYLWARRIAGDWAGVGAGVLAAISPFAVYYSQEARAYALVALLTAVGCWTLTECFLAHGEGRRCRRWMVGHVLATAGLLWSHYLGLVVLVLYNLVAAAWLWGRLDRSVRLKEWAAMQLAAVIVFVPWLPQMLGSAGSWPAISAHEPLSFYLSELARLYTLGPGAEGMTRWAWLALAPAAVGVVAGMMRGRHRLLWSLVILAALWPALALWLLSFLRPAYRAKFLLLGLPAYHVLAGAGMAGPALWSGRRRGWALGLLVGAALGALAFPASCSGLTGYLSGRQSVKDDYRGLAAYITAAAGSDGAVVVNAPGQMEVFSYYYRGEAPLYALPSSRPPDAATLEGELAAIAAGHPRIFSVIWATAESDPEGVMERWLDAHAYKASDVWFGNVRLTLHETPSSMPRERETHAIFGDIIALESYALSEAGVRPGTAAPVSLVWRRSGVVADEYALFVQVLDERSNIVGQRDAALSERRSVAEWLPDEEIDDKQAVPIMLGTPPGAYAVVAGLYSLTTGARLTLPDGSDRMQLGTVEVLPTQVLSAGALRATQTQEVGLGPLRLMAWDVSPLGGAPGVQVETAAGAPLSLVFYWRVLEPAEAQMEFLLDAGGQSRPIGQVPALSQALALGRWEVGQTYRDPHIVFLPGDLQPGEYRLSVVANAGGGQGQVDLGRVLIR